MIVKKISKKKKKKRMLPRRRQQHISFKKSPHQKAHPKKIRTRSRLLTIEKAILVKNANGRFSTKYCYKQIR
jgi:hypothetical protein